jgi:GH15 family glucan-1,4-alpha-glucosidase
VYNPIDRISAPELANENCKQIASKPGNADNSVQPLIDSSSDVVVALGAVDHESGRASAHISTIVNTLNQQTYGLCRYLGDTFYYTGTWSPGGNEALGPEPSWPQMSMWVAIYEILTGDLATALSRLQ